MDLPTGLASLCQGSDNVLPGDVIQEDVFTAISPAHDMIHGPGIFNAQFARHGGELRPPCPFLWSDPFADTLHLTRMTLSRSFTRMREPMLRTFAEDLQGCLLYHLTVRQSVTDRRALGLRQ